MENHRAEKQIEIIFNENFRSLVFTSFGIVRNYEQAEDIVQNLFVKIWQNFEKVEHIGNLKPYLHKAVKIDPHLMDAWIELAVFIERNSLPPSSELLDVLAAGLSYNPNNKELYERFIALAFWNSEERRAVAVLDTLLDRFSVTWKFNLI